MAARHFEHYLNHRDTTTTLPFVPLEWGDFPKTALVEFIYACFEANVFRNTTLRNITKILSFAFGLMLSEQEVNQKWQEIKARKKEKIIFLHTLQTALLRRLERQDQ